MGHAAQLRYAAELWANCRKDFTPEACAAVRRWYLVFRKKHTYGDALCLALGLTPRCVA